MAVAALTGHGDPQVQALLPAIVSPGRVALVGLHAWATDDIANVAHWGIRAFSPDDLRETTQPLGDWLTTAQVRRIVEDVDAVADVVGITVAEFIPRQVMHLQQLLTGFPLIRALTST
jgi:arginase